MLTGVAAELALALAFGLHAESPWRLARAPEPSRRLWALAALPALLAATILAWVHLAYHPDAALAWGITPLATDSSRGTRILAILVGALLALDVTLFFSWRSWEPAAWRFATLFGWAALLALVWILEQLRIGDGPLPPLSWIVLSTAGRLPLPLAAAAAARRTARSFWWTAAGLGLPLSFAYYHPDLRLALRPDLPALAAASLLLLGAAFLPARLRRPAAAAGVLIAILFLVLAANVSESLPPPPATDDPALESF
ncbi:MAG: hypothetical protein U0X73_08995 [Thermoanaerobaculia bacterium]